MYSLYSALYTVQFILCTEQCTVYTVYCKMYSCYCTLYNVQFIQCTVQCTVVTVHYTMYSLYSAPYSVQLLLYTVQCTFFYCALFNVLCKDCLQSKFHNEECTVHSFLPLTTGCQQRLNGAATTNSPEEWKSCQTAFLCNSATKDSKTTSLVFLLRIISNNICITTLIF